MIFIINKHKQGALIEEYLTGREFTAGIIGTGKNAKVIGIMDFVKKLKVYLHKNTFNFSSR